MRKPTRYRMLSDSKIQAEAVAGTLVYKCKFHDYGLAGDDTRMTGIEHISVSLTEDGDYPFFTVPKVQLEDVPYD